MINVDWGKNQRIRVDSTRVGKTATGVGGKKRGTLQSILQIRWKCVLASAARQPPLFSRRAKLTKAVLARCKVQPGGKFKTRGMVLYNVSSEAWNGDFQKILRNTDPYKVILRWRDGNGVRIRRIGEFCARLFWHFFVSWDLTFQYSKSYLKEIMLQSV